MSIYLVGDIQGCFSELQSLLERVKFDPSIDELWAAGDIVARGPNSLETIRFIKSLGNSAKMVLGNHDLHLLATFAGLKKVKKSDRLTDLLVASDVEELIDWLANQPLIRKIPNESAYMSHAGISPQWSIKKALKHAKKAEEKISGPNRSEWLSKMYGEYPQSWQDAKSEEEKFRFTINSLTRMRFCYEDLSLELQSKQTPDKSITNIQPWFKHNKALKGSTWIFGHWASLMGETGLKNLYALDTGCVWGNHLTLMRWHDRAVFIEPAHEL